MMSVEALARRLGALCVTPARPEQRMTRAEMQREIERLELGAFRDAHDGRDPVDDAELAAFRVEDEAAFEAWCRARPQDLQAREALHLVELLRRHDAADAADAAARTATEAEIAAGWARQAEFERIEADAGGESP
jgi:hypothetical protein